MLLTELPVDMQRRFSDGGSIDAIEPSPRPTYFPDALRRDGDHHICVFLLGRALLLTQSALGRYYLFYNAGSALDVQRILHK